MRRNYKGGKKERRGEQEGGGVEGRSGREWHERKGDEETKSRGD